ncbi:MAG: 23S rRNA (adenine(2030)-N(6))-methyltransferase RlmJ [Marinobacter sp.]|uniref:23S rRNA (adenine(2030)-N(6))-methyltransferase RlmJ n=1 Tax=Marinobacter sp. TaxID=50741 RepID=UPI0034A02595
MLSYLHAFHAGNFADVQKHSALYLVLKLMQAKSSPIAYFDTHGGSGLYDLNSERARKTAEAAEGIQVLWSQRQTLASPDWQGFMDHLQRVNKGSDTLVRYPGSPAWLADSCRSQDSATCFELHPSEGGQLSRWAGSTALQVRRQDGLQGLLGCLPPNKPRLLALIDPSYEVKTEYKQVADTLAKAWQRCRHGVYLVWYPLLPKQEHKTLLSAIGSGKISKVLRSEVILNRPPDRGMYGSGMLVINPPWGFEERYTAMLRDAVRPDVINGLHQLDWLVPEP